MCCLNEYWNIIATPKDDVFYAYKWNVWICVDGDNIYHIFTVSIIVTVKYTTCFTVSFFVTVKYTTYFTVSFFVTVLKYWDL